MQCDKVDLQRRSLEVRQQWLRAGDSNSWNQQLQTGATPHPVQLLASACCGVVRLVGWLARAAWSVCRPCRPWARHMRLLSDSLRKVLPPNTVGMACVAQSQEQGWKVAAGRLVTGAVFPFVDAVLGKCMLQSPRS
jgi:hypothetical protein